MHVHEVLRRDRENYAKGVAKVAAKEAKKEGIKEGKLKQTVIVARKMLEEKIDIKLITKITGLKKEQFMK